MSQTDVAVNAIVRRGVADVIPDGWATRDGFVRVPRPKRKSQRVHIRIGADARIAEEIPSSADCIAGFQNRVGFSREGSLQMVSSINTGYAGAHDQHVKMF